MTPAMISALQRSIGNQAAVRLLRAEEEPHEHSEGCEHQADGQRAAVDAGLGSPARPLDGVTLAEKEDKFHADFSGVRIHRGPAAARAAAAVEARAFTVHQDIVLGERGDEPEVLDHELTHVVRNQQGTAVGHDTGGGFAMTHPNDDAEREAASNAARMRSGGASTVLGEGRGAATPPVTSVARVQRWYEGEANPMSSLGSRNITPKRRKTPALEQRVAAFVNGLERPAWYPGTRDAVIDRAEKRHFTDPFTERPALIWQCASCENGVTYPGIDIGHRVPWKEYLLSKGVLTKVEATAAYNDLRNLQIECATCNRSHDYERTADGEYQSAAEDSPAHSSDEDFIASDNDSLGYESGAGGASPARRSTQSSGRMSM
jgi:hypothetical protein